MPWTDSVRWSRCAKDEAAILEHYQRPDLVTDQWIVYVYVDQTPSHGVLRPVYASGKEGLWSVWGLLLIRLPERISGV
jgi:hypothetical protein